MNKAAKPPPAMSGARRGAHHAAEKRAAREAREAQRAQEANRGGGACGAGSVPRRACNCARKPSSRKLQGLAGARSEERNTSPTRCQVCQRCCAAASLAHKAKAS